MNLEIPTTYICVYNVTQILITQTHTHVSKIVSRRLVFGIEIKQNKRNT